MKILCPLMELMSRYNVNKRWRKQRGNQVWTAQRQWQHWAHSIKLKLYNGHIRHRTKTAKHEPHQIKIKMKCLLYLFLNFVLLRYTNI